jgi:hypothetical protein
MLAIRVQPSITGVVVAVPAMYTHSVLRTCHGATYQHHLGVGLEPDYAVDDYGAGLLQPPAGGRVGFLVEAGAQSVQSRQ